MLLEYQLSLVIRGGERSDIGAWRVRGREAGNEGRGGNAWEKRDIAGFFMEVIQRARSINFFNYKIIRRSHVVAAQTAGRRGIAVGGREGSAGGAEVIWRALGARWQARSTAVALARGGGEGGVSVPPIGLLILKRKLSPSRRHMAMTSAPTGSHARA